MQATQGGGYYVCDNGDTINSADYDAWNNVFHLLALTSRYPTPTFSQFLAEHCTYHSDITAIPMTTVITVPPKGPSTPAEYEFFDI